MLDWIFDLFSNRNLGAARSSGWASASRAYRKEQPLCIFGMHKPTLLNPLNSHHVKNFKDFPELEMEKSNWENVCRFHHFYHCHLGDWKSIEKDVRALAKAYTLRVKNRP